MTYEDGVTGRTPRRGRRAAFVVTATVLLIVFLVVWFAFVEPGRAETEAEKRNAAVKASLSFKLVPSKDLPTLWGPAPAPEDNAAPLYKEAFAIQDRLLEGVGDEDGYREGDEETDARVREMDTLLVMVGVLPPEELPDEPEGDEDDEDLGEDEAVEDDEPRAPPMDVTRIRAFLEDFKEVLALRDRAVARPSCRFERDYTYAQEVLLPELSSVFALSNLMAIEAAAAAAEGRTDKAFDALRKMLALSEHLRQEPHIIQVLVAIAIRDLALERMAWLLHRTSPDDEMRRKIVALLQPRAQSTIRLMLVSETVGVSGMFDLMLIAPPSDDAREAFERGRLRAFMAGNTFRGRILDGQSSYLELMDKYIRAASQPPVTYSVAFATFDQEFEDALDRLAGDSPWPELPETIGLRLIPAVAGSSEEIWRGETEALLARVALRVVHHRKAHGQWPAALGDLSDAASLPADPFGGKPLRYRRDADGFRLWSVGFDGDDDGGKTNVELDADLADDGDIVFRVPPVEAAGGGSP